MTKYQLFVCKIPDGTPEVIKEELLEDFQDDLSKKGWTVLSKTVKGDSVVFNCKKEGVDGF